ncbi:MAG: Hsp20/alpha crystallin family protein [Planctomycetota bacterium]|nr:Hsp20/alpha crystallin family protein [Planctomycetota bacterium]
MRDSLTLETPRYASHKCSHRDVAFSEELVSGNLVVMLTESAWMPPTDVYETQTEVIVKMELAGVGPEDIDIKLEGRRLLVSGRRVDTSSAIKRSFKQLEINYGRFERAIVFDEGTRLTTGRASYKDGFLLISLTKARQRGATQIVSVKLEC